MTKQINIPYGVGHSKFYNKSIIADFLVDKDDDNNISHINSDVNLLLRQKTIHRKVGIDQLREYVQGLMHDNPDMPDFTDDELFQLIEPKSINNLTTCYEYAKYLQANSKDVKSRFETLKKHKLSYANLINSKKE